MSSTPPEFHKEDTQPVERTQQLKRVKLPGGQQQTGGGTHSWPFGYLLLWLLTTLSLLLNAVMLRQMLIARSIARQAVSDATAIVENLKEQTITYTIVVDDTLAIETDLPVDETIPVTIEQTIPVDVVVTVPVNAGLFGRINLDVPIQTSIPVNLRQDIEIDQTFHVDTAVPINLAIPVEIRVRDTPFAVLLDDFAGRLGRLESSLNAPLVPIPSR